MVVVVATIVDVEAVVVVVDNSEFVPTTDFAFGEAAGNITEADNFNVVLSVTAIDDVDDGNASTIPLVNVVAVAVVVVIDVGLFSFSFSSSALLEFITCSQARGFVTFLVNNRDFASA